ncbi:MAG: hypothetical protein AB7K09_08125 [Planctomycetota bacterium]
MRSHSHSHSHSLLLALLLVVAVCMSPGCASSTPGSNAVSSGSSGGSGANSGASATTGGNSGTTVVVEPAKYIIDMGGKTEPVGSVGMTAPRNAPPPGNNNSAANAANTANPAGALQPRPGEVLLQRSADPAAHPLPPVAPDGVLGMYHATLDYTRAEDYGLMIYEHNDQKQWMLMQNPRQPEMLGFGTLQERPGGYEFVELQRQNNAPPRQVAMQRFPVETSPNCWTISQPAPEGQGETALGKLLHKLGTDVHWIRTWACDKDNPEVRTPVALPMGTFHPLSQRLPDRPGFTVDMAKELVIWPDGNWRWIEDVAPGERRVSGGRWELQSDRQSIVLTQTLPPDPQRLNDPPSELFALVYDNENHVMWLTKRAADPHGATTVLPDTSGDEHTVVYVQNNQ